MKCFYTTKYNITTNDVIIPTINDFSTKDIFSCPESVMISKLFFIIKSPQK